MAYHRVVRAIHRALPITLFWVYVGAFGLAFLCMFLHPVVTILLLWLGLTSLGFMVAITHILGAMRRSSALRILRQGQCPVCGAEGVTAAAPVSGLDPTGGNLELDHVCEGCGACFERSSGHERDTN